MMGIIFGVGAVIAMLSIGAGAEQQALATISRLGLQNVIVRSKSFREEELQEVRKNSPGLSMRDVEAIGDAIPGVDLIAPKIRIEPYKTVSSLGSTNAVVFGVSQHHDRLVNLELAAGRFFDAFDMRQHAQVAVIGDGVSRDLFGYRNALGEHLKINDLWLEVIGVLTSQLGGENDSFQGVQLGSTNSMIYIPVTSALRKFDHRPLQAPLDEIVVRMRSPEEGRTTAKLIGSLLGHLHAYEEDFELIVPEALLAESRRTQRMFNIVMGSIAGISLLVGGIGIMNIMLASILERTREIGLRRAVGARRQDLMTQFLSESFALSAIGGLSGIIMGILISKVVGASAGWTTVVRLWTVLLATGVAVAVGLASGVYPAIRASKLDPIDALRHE
jgi:putative ABC transport system permease protein